MLLVPILLIVLYFMLHDFFKSEKYHQFIVQRKSEHFASLISKFFDKKGHESIFDYLIDHSDSMGKYVSFVFDTYVADLKKHYDKYLWVLVYRRGIFSTTIYSKESLDRVSMDCHQYFMCIVLQLRMCGEVRDMGAVDKFKRHFKQFIRYHSVNMMWRKLKAVHRELEHLRSKIPYCDETELDEIEERCRNCMEEIDELVDLKSKEIHRPQVVFFMLNPLFNAEVFKLQDQGPHELPTQEQQNHALDHGRSEGNHAGQGRYQGSPDVGGQATCQ